MQYKWITVPRQHQKCETETRDIATTNREQMILHLHQVKQGHSNGATGRPHQERRDMTKLRIALFTNNLKQSA
jgi:hypothetical protein